MPVVDRDSPVLPAFVANDDYLPGAFRDLLHEAEGCLERGFLTGGTACARRALDLLLTVSKTDGTSEEDRLSSLGEQHGVSRMLTSILVQCGGASVRDNTTLSAEVLQLSIVTLKAVVYELYVVGPERMQRLQYVSGLVASVGRKPLVERRDGHQPASASEDETVIVLDGQNTSAVGIADDVREDMPSAEIRSSNREHAESNRRIIRSAAMLSSAG